LKIIACKTAGGPDELKRYQSYFADSDRQELLTLRILTFLF